MGWVGTGSPGWRVCLQDELVGPLIWSSGLVGFQVVTSCVFGPCRYSGRVIFFVGCGTTRQKDLCFLTLALCTWL